MKDYKKDKIAWCITDGAAGNVSQVKGLASAMKLDFQLKVVKLRFPWKFLPVGYLPSFGLAIKHLDTLRDEAIPSYIITAGRKSIYSSLYLKNKFKNKVKTIHIQDPKINSKLFDCVVAPEHDSISGQNVIKSKFAINHINDQLLFLEAKKFQEKLSFLKKPIVTVILGGKNKNYHFDKSQLFELEKKIDLINNKNSISLVFLFSRRTDNFIKDFIIKKYSHKHTVWTDQKNNPYLALLHLSSCIICTGDSVSMISEALNSGKSVYVFRLKSKKKYNRIEKFNDKLLELGYIRELNKTLVFDQTNLENETEIIAKKIIENY
jgi:mitochondrial fission protein ELM1